MSGIQFVMDEKGRKVGMLLGLKKQASGGAVRYLSEIKRSAQRNWTRWMTHPLLG
jgi:hypothetical protein